MSKSDLMTTMDKLTRIFEAECRRVDPLHPDVQCDTDFIKSYLTAYDYYRLCMLVPEDYLGYAIFLSRLEVAMKEVTIRAKALYDEDLRRIAK